MGGRKDLVAAHKGDSGMELTGADGVLGLKNLLFQLHVLDEALILSVVFVKSCVQRQEVLTAYGEENSSLGGYSHIPDGVMCRIIQTELVGHAGLGDQVEKFLGFIFQKSVLAFHS